jgi:DNA (cytosine-5)-methyltransferase 1
VDNLLIENVREFRDWGPVGSNGKPLKSRKGETYRAWLNALRSFGYEVDDRILNAADYGDPTSRERLFVLARKGRKAIKWPEPSHGAPGNLYGLQPYRTAREVIDWSIKGKSIFGRKKPLAPSTMARIAAGLKRYGGANAKPFLVMLYGTGEARDIDRPMPTITGGGNHTGLCEPFVVTLTHNGGDDNRAHSIDKPMPTITGAHRGEMALVEPFLLGQQSCAAPRDVDQPVPTIATAGAISLVEPFLVKYYGAGEGVSSTDDPVPTITTKDRFGLVEISGKYQIDIRFRMLQPHELAAAMSFENYTFTGTKTQQTKQIGNAVPVRLAQALCTSLMRN